MLLDLFSQSRECADLNLDFMPRFAPPLKSPSTYSESVYSDRLGTQQLLMGAMAIRHHLGCVSDEIGV